MASMKEKASPPSSKPTKSGGGYESIAAAIHGSNRLNIEAKYKGMVGKSYTMRKKVSMNNTATVWEVEETYSASPNKGANKDDGVIKDVINSACDDIVEGVPNGGHQIETLQQVDSTCSRALDGCEGEIISVDNGNKHVGTMHSSPKHADGTYRTRKDGKKGNDESFASMLNSIHVPKKLNFRLFVNEDKVENFDIILQEAIDKVKNNSGTDLKKEVIMAVSNDHGTCYTKEVIVREYVTSTTTDMTSDRFMEVKRKKNKAKKADQQPMSRHIDDVRDECGVSSSMSNQEEEQAVGHATASKHTSYTWNEDNKSDDEVDKVIYLRSLVISLIFGLKVELGNSQITDKYFFEYTRIEVKHFRDTLLQHMGNVKKFVAQRTRHQRQYDRRINKRQMQTQKSKIDTGKAVDIDLVVTKSDETESKVQDDNSWSGNDTDADDADIRPIYDEEPMAEYFLQMSTQQDIYAAGFENRPPMLNKENYVSWSSRLLRYAKSRPNEKLIHNSIINGPYVRRMTCDPNREVLVNETLHVQTDDELTEKELKQIDADDQTIQNILLSLPEDIYAAVDSCETAQEIWLHYTQLYDFLKYNQKEVDDLKAKRLTGTQDPLALMAPSNNPYTFLVLHQDQPSFNRNYMQQPMPNREDITDPTTAMNMTLALMAKAFKLNYSTSTNNNQRISSNPRNRQIAQPGIDMSQDRQMQMVGSNGKNQFRQYARQNVGNLNGYNDVWKVRNQVIQNAAQNPRVQNVRNQNGLIGVPGNANQNLNGNGNLVAARAKGIQLQAEEFGLMAAAADLDEIEEVNANYILMANLQQALTSGTQTDKAPVYDSDESAENDNNVISEATSVEQSGGTIAQHSTNVDETRVLYDSLYHNLAIEVEKVNTVNPKFVGDFKSLAKEADESLAKHKALELKIERLLRAVDNTRGMSANTNFAKQSIIGNLPKVTETHALSKPVTSNSIPTSQKSKVVKNDKVIAPGMFRINPFQNSREEKHVPNKVRASFRTKHITVSQPTVFTKKVGYSDSNGLSSTGNVKSKVVYAMCNQCLISVNHDVCLLNYVNGKTSRGKKQKANVSINEKQKKQQPKVKKTKKVRFIKRLATPKPSKPRSFLRWSPTGRLFDLKSKLIASSKSESKSDCLKGDNACTSNPLEPTIKRFPNSTFSLAGVDLLSRNRTTNLYTINLHEMASASPICLMARASSTKSWLWHQRLSHLSFDTINDLAKNDLVSSLPKFKNHKEHLCPSCEQGKSKRVSHPPKLVPNSRQRNQVLKEYFDSVGISHQVSSVRTPQQNGVVERRNRTLVEAARTMLILSHAPLFIWAEAIATACFTQNRSIIHRRFNKTPYELINGRKSDISFLHVFGALCYPKNDCEDIGKLGAKGDIGFFIGYSADSYAFRVSKFEIQSMTYGQISSGLDFTYAPSTITTQQPTEGELDLLFEAMYDDYIGGHPSATLRTVTAAQAHQDRQTSTASTSIADTAPTPTNSSSQAINFPNISQEVDELNTQQQHAQQQGNQAPL
nr:hypothetical protein [Tanacetum cinerariifolium]